MYDKQTLELKRLEKVFNNLHLYPREEDDDEDTEQDRIQQQVEVDKLYDVVNEYGSPELLEAISPEEVTDMPAFVAARKKEIQDAISNSVPCDMRKNPLENFDNYGPYKSIALGLKMTVDVAKINKDNWEDHYRGIINILKDGIFSLYVQKYFLEINFGRGKICHLSIPDYFFNLIMWKPIIFIGQKVKPKNLFFPKNITAKDIKNYIDDFVINDNRITHSTRELSITISDTLYHYHDIEQFANYLCNTLNLEDSAELMDRDPKFFKALHGSYSGLQVDQVKSAIMADARTSIERIEVSKKLLGYDHCLADAWRANEGINPKQYAEFTIAIGIKPDGRGGIFPEIADTSFIGGGLIDPVNYFIESSTSRIAQILKFKNVSKSGTLARIMSLNNMDSYLYPDPNYDCHSRNLIPTIVKTDGHLKHLNLRFYRLDPMGREMEINYKRDKHLIGKTIYLRSPCTCASAARGQGVCYRCYGNLAYSVFDIVTKQGINIGRIASELITAKQTQKQLSAKHILEASVDRIEWEEGFDKLFDMENTVIRISQYVDNPSDFRMYIRKDAIEADTDEDDDDSENYDEYISEFEIVQKSTGQSWTIRTKNHEHLYLTNEMNAVIRKKATPSGERLNIPISALSDIPLFYLKVQNNELIKILNKLKHLYNRGEEVKRYDTIPELLQQILDTNIEGSMDISAVHYELILSNQIRDIDDVLERPDWDQINPPYRILTLDEALTKNPSVTIALSYQKITRALYDPLTYRKHGPSFMDLFFMNKPQLVIRDITPADTEVVKRDPGELYEPFTKLEDSDKVTADSSEFEDDSEILDVEE